MQKLNVKAFALACGVSFGAYALLLGWIAASGWGSGIVAMLSSMYLGYAPTFVGGIVGAIVAWVYNAMIKKG